MQGEAPIFWSSDMLWLIKLQHVAAWHFDEASKKIFVNQPRSSLHDLQAFRPPETSTCFSILHSAVNPTLPQHLCYLRTQANLTCFKSNLDKPWNPQALDSSLFIHIQLDQLLHKRNIGQEWSGCLFRKASSRSLTKGVAIRSLLDLASLAAGMACVDGRRGTTGTIEP